MARSNNLKTHISLFVIIVITFLSGARGAEEETPTVEYLLYQGRTELGKDNPTGAIEYFTKALNKCNPGSTSYNSRYGRCNFFVGEGYFQRFEMQRNISDAKTAIKYFEIVIDFGKKTSEDYPSKAKMRILQLEQTLARIDTGTTDGQRTEYRVRSLVKGSISPEKWQIYLGDERLDNPFVDVFFILDKSNEIIKEKRAAVYISISTAASVCKYTGVNMSSEKVTPQYGDDNVLNRLEAFRKPGYSEVLLRNGRKWNGYWAMVEYDLMNAMPAIPVNLFEHFGATVNIEWSRQRVTVAMKDASLQAAVSVQSQIKDNKPVYPKDIAWVSINDPGVSGHEGFSGRMSKYETTNAQYCEFLNAALTTDDITVTRSNHQSAVKGANGSNAGADFVGEVYYDLAGPGFTYDGATKGGAARINYTGSLFTVDSGFEKHPVNHVSWYGATAFCNYYGYRLPTEWEWMAVADYDGSYGYNKYGCGTSINNSKANYLGSTHPYGTTPVGTFGMYGYGIADMTGNVWELVSLDEHGFRITCGGSWHTNKELCTVMFRYRDLDLHKSGNNIGFRACRGQRVTLAKPRVNESTTTQKPSESASIPAKDKGPTEAARKFITALYSRSYDEMLEVVSDDVYAYLGGKGSYQLPYGRKAFKEYASSFSFDKPPKIISVKEKNRLEGGTIALIEAGLDFSGENKYTLTLWFKKVNSQWLLFTPTTNLAGYRNSDVQAALQSFANTWARRGDISYVNCRIKKAVPNTLQHTESLWLEIEYEYTSNNYYGIGRAKSGTRISAVWMNRKSGSWEYGGMYNQ